MRQRYPREAELRPGRCPERRSADPQKQGCLRGCLSPRADLGSLLVLDGVRVNRCENQVSRSEAETLWRRLVVDLVLDDPRELAFML